MSEFRFAIALALLVVTAPQGAAAQTAAPAKEVTDRRDPICRVIESVARANALPVEFFTRVIWQESRFQPDVVGPVTRSGERAEGIAQFMPATAAEHSLVEPFNPEEALPKSGEFLAELRAEFGNLGLAAAAYNAGPPRVHDFIAGSRDLPAETRNYVVAVTGRPVDDWLKPAMRTSMARMSNDRPASSATTSCHDLVALLERTPNPLNTLWHGRNVPDWCRGLHHPDTSICGPVHLIIPADTATNPAIPRSHVHLFKTSSR
jgi:hypothetical protein